MTRKRSLKDKDIVNLLGQLKSARSEYPAELKSRRRALFLGSIAGGMLPGAASHVKLPHGAEAPLSAGMKVAIGVLTTAAIAVTASLGVLAYQNRAILADRLFGRTPNSVYSGPIPASTSLLAPMDSPTSSPVPELTPSTTATVTPDPDDTPAANTTIPNNGPADNNPGRHLGQTPHPDGTPPGH